MKYHFDGFTDKANEALNFAIHSAGQLGHTYVGSEHLLLGLLKVPDSVAGTLLREHGVTAEKIETALRQTIGAGTATKLSPEYLTPRAKRVIETAMGDCAARGKRTVGTENLLFGILSDDDNYGLRFLRECDVDLNELIAATQTAVETGESIQNGTAHQKNPPDDKKTPTLQKFGHNLTALAREGKTDPVIGRADEIMRVIQILCRRTKNNPCLIGEPGVGKTAIVEGLAQKIAAGDVPEILQGKQVYSLDLTSMVAGTKYRGDFEERIRAVMEEVTANANVILFIDEVHTIIGAGSAEGSTDAANILKPALARGEFQLIGATTITEYRKNIEKDSALERRFQPVTVAEPSEDDALLILKGLKDKYEAHHKVTIPDETLETAVKLSARYINDRFLPDKAIDLVDEAASRVRICTKAPDELKALQEKIKEAETQKDDAICAQDFEKAAILRDSVKELKAELEEKKKAWQAENHHRNGVVTPENIAEIVSQWTSVPVTQLNREESDRLLQLESVLHERLVGQNEAVTAVAKAIRRGRAGLKDPKRPIGSFLFLGPTGVGKTELARALAEAMFGSEDRMVRFDMSEYMEKHTVSRLVGSPPGYVGFEEGGQLTEQVRRHPYSVLLFDEIEKAHPDVFNILLQVLEDGILTDSQGRKVDFKNTVIIMTSNIGARRITEKKISFGFGAAANDGNEDIKQQVLSELREAFRPEFLNRVDDLIVFRKLTQEDIAEIAKRLLKNLEKRLANLNIAVRFTDAAVEAVAKNGFDPIYGARPLRREIQNSLEDPISEKILDGSLQNGDTLLCDFSDGKFSFQTEKT